MDNDNYTSSIAKKLWVEHTLEEANDLLKEAERKIFEVQFRLRERDETRYEWRGLHKFRIDINAMRDTIKGSMHTIANLLAFGKEEI